MCGDLLWRVSMKVVVGDLKLVSFETAKIFFMTLTIRYHSPSLSHRYRSPSLSHREQPLGPQDRCSPQQTSSTSSKRPYNSSNALTFPGTKLYISPDRVPPPRPHPSDLDLRLLYDHKDILLIGGDEDFVLLAA